MKARLINGPEGFTVSIDAKTWGSAACAMIVCHDADRQIAIVEGHKLIAAKVVRRGKKGGQRCQLHLVFRHTDKNTDPVRRSEEAERLANEIFSAEITICNQVVAMGTLSRESCELS